MTKENSTNCFGEKISETAEYFKIAMAAARLGCTADDLLHLGVIGKLEILAAVVQGKEYQWPNENAGIAFPELENDFSVYFDAADRVFITKEDLARIEAVGWVRLKRFYAPEKARGVIVDWRSLLFDSPSDEDDPSFEETRSRLTQILRDQLSNLDAPDAEICSITSSSSLGPTETISLTAKGCLEKAAQYVQRMNSSQDEEQKKVLEAFAFNSVWEAKGECEEVGEVTTINHLFVSSKELNRLIKGLPQDESSLLRNNSVNVGPPVKVHGNTERNAEKNFSILMAAIYCKDKWPESCTTLIGWANTIEINSKTFWGDNFPPRERNTIERLLGKALGSGSVKK